MKLFLCVAILSAGALAAPLLHPLADLVGETPMTQEFHTEDMLLQLDDPVAALHPLRAKKQVAEDKQFTAELLAAAVKKGKQRFAKNADNFKAFVDAGKDQIEDGKAPTGVIQDLEKDYIESEAKAAKAHKKINPEEVFSNWVAAEKNKHFDGLAKTIVQQAQTAVESGKGILHTVNGHVEVDASELGM